MATKRVKEKNGTGENLDLEPEDRISDLPDAVVLHILSFLPTIAAVRTSFLSKRWRRMWTLVPVLDFYDQRDLDYLRKPNGNKDRKKFFKFVNECLKHPYADTTITRFKLKAEFYGGGHRVDGWLKFPVNKSVKELDLHVSPTNSVYCLPSAILCMRTLTVLNLNGLELLISSTKVCLPSLKVLHLVNIDMHDLALNNLLLGCPYLEKLHIHYCSGLLNPLVLSSSMKSMEYRAGYRNYAQTMEVDARNLLSFVYKGGNNKCNINLVRCVAVRNLSFSGACLTHQWLEDLIPQLSFLESLNVDSCYGVKHIKIMNQHLKNLDLDCRTDELDLLEVAVDAPSLVSFTYSGYLMLRISVNAPDLLYADINVCGQLKKAAYDMEWYTRLINFLSEFNGTKKIHIFCGYEKAIIIPNELREIYPSPLSDLKYLKVKTAFPLFRKVMFKKSLLWIAPSLETLAIE
ncbi:F-box domain containing protein [Trema orientale]|uniref:F-box domain containing protein n=1 Tax=Trema orientale TaxID=63057 RepID=A0A2P5ER64_TREOI|nr:F-box domain containing protein [Trema orientale]